MRWRYKEVMKWWVVWLFGCLVGWGNKESVLRRLVDLYV